MPVFERMEQLKRPEWGDNVAPFFSARDSNVANVRVGRPKLQSTERPRDQKNQRNTDDHTDDEKCSGYDRG